MIPVVFVCDEKYAMPTSVAIISLMENRKSTTDYDIFVIGCGLSEESKTKLKLAGGDALRILEQSLPSLEQVPVHEYVSRAALCKFEISDFLHNYDKAVYLDSDVIVNGDLSDLYKTNIDECYAGMVKDFYAHLIEHDDLRLNYKVYYNSGVMLLNLKKMRADNISQKLIEEKKNNLYSKYMDQDVFNIVFKDNIKLLAPEFNFMLYSKDDLNHFYEVYNSNIPAKPVIIHYPGIKPWKEKCCLNFKNWYKYYKKSPYKKNRLPVFKNDLIKRRRNITNSIFSFFGYKIFRILSDFDKYLELLKNNGAVIDLNTNVIEFPEINIKLKYSNAEDLREIYEVFVLKKIGFKPSNKEWSIVDFSESYVSVMYFASLEEVEEVIVLQVQDKNLLFQDNIKLNPYYGEKIKFCNNIVHGGAADKQILYNFSCANDDYNLYGKLNEYALSGKANIIMVEIHGFGIDVVRKILTESGYTSFYTCEDRHRGFIKAFK